MNPVVVIGLVAVISAGMYGMYDAIQQQAELGQIQRVALEREMISNTPNIVRGELQGSQHDQNVHVIITNNSPENTAQLIQIRAHDKKSSDLIGTWDVSYEVPPLQTQNLSAVGAMPPALQGMLLATVNGTGKTEYAYAGVTARGVIFDIDTDAYRLHALAEGMTDGISDDAYGPVVFAATNATSRSVFSQQGIEYYYATDSFCKSGHNRGEYYSKIYDNPKFIPSSVTYPTGNPWSDGGPIGGLGSQAYRMWNGTFTTTGTVVGPACPPDIKTDTNPLGLRLYKYGSIVVAGYRVLTPSTFDVSVNRQAQSDEIKIKGDVNDVAVGVQVPLFIDAQTTHAVSVQGQCPRVDGCHCFTPENARIRVNEIKKSLAHVTPNISTELIISDVPKNRPSAVLAQENTNHVNDHTVEDNTIYRWAIEDRNGNVRTLQDWGQVSQITHLPPDGDKCNYYIHGTIDSNWIYRGSLDQVMQINGAGITDGVIRAEIDSGVSLAPQETAYTTVTASAGKVEIGQAVIMIGTR